jgi:hypothetical protein
MILNGSCFLCREARAQVPESALIGKGRTCTIAYPSVERGRMHMHFTPTPYSASQQLRARRSRLRLTKVSSRPRSQFDFEDFGFLFAFSWSISIFSVVYRALQDIYFQARRQHPQRGLTQLDRSGRESGNGGGCSLAHGRRRCGRIQLAL